MAQNNIDWKLIGIMTTVFVAMLATYDYRSKYNEIDDTITKGTNPPLIIDHEVVDRSDIAKEIVNSFIAAPENVHDFKPFGIIIGPTGTGKTQLIRQVCRQNPKGVLYVEIASTDTFVENLAKTIGMRITSPFASVFIETFFSSYTGYFKLPENDYPKAIATVIENLLERALAFKKREGRPVCLFIDAADLLAKHEPEVFRKLVDTAKSHANSGSLRIVFGCSEGSVLPIIDSTSSRSRIKPIEVGDLPDDKAIDYLKKCRMPDNLATRIVKFVGGRVIFLRRSVMTYRDRKSNTRNDIYEEIIKDLNAHFAIAAIQALVMGDSIAIDIIKHLEESNGSGFYLYEYLENFSTKEKVKVESLIQSLIQKNAFRLTAQREVAWHSRLIRNKAIELFKKSNKL